MRINSTFDVLGPIMAGPSSSHTAGALRIARLAASLCHTPISSVDFTLYNSFARTYQGHGTDRALIAGILGMHTSDPRIRDSFELAREQGISWNFTCIADAPELHPNTVGIVLHGTDGTTTSVRGESVGGGAIHISLINDVEVDISGRMPTFVVAHQDLPGMLALMCGKLGDAGVNIAYMSSYRTSPGQSAYAVFETDTAVDEAVVADIAATPHVMDAYIVRVPGTLPPFAESPTPYDFETASELLGIAEKNGLSLGAVMRRREDDLRGHDAAQEYMDEILQVMKDEVKSSIAQPLPSLGGLIGGETQRLYATVGSSSDICGSTLTRAVSYALATLERSAAMGVIVAAPTAGSAGIVPGSLLALQEERSISDEDICDALYAAAAIGAIVEHEASVAGAEGGCQAEVGTASAMAATALVQLLGGTPEAALAAASLAMADLLGLVCDPVRGLVEIPCETRNAVGVANAFAAAQMACAGIALPMGFDEVVEAMRCVGHALPATLRETALGGLAVCPSVCDAETGCPQANAASGCPQADTLGSCPQA